MKNKNAFLTPPIQISAETAFMHQTSHGKTNLQRKHFQIVFKEMSNFTGIDIDLECNGYCSL